MKNKVINYIKQMGYSLISLVLLFASFFIKRDKRMLAFGSWRGQLYIDNSKYLLEEALKKYGREYKFLWIGNDLVREQLPKDSRVICAKKNSVKSLYYLLKSKYMFFTQFHFEDISNYNVYYKAKLVYLHHGCPLKKWGDDISCKKKKNVIKRILDLINGVSRKIDYFVSSSDAHFNVNLTALHSYGCNENNNLRIGTPRNDFLINCKKEQVEKYKQLYAENLGFSPHKKVILYLPTFRRSGVNNESLIYRDEKELQQLSTLLDKLDCVLLEKAHFAGEFNVSYVNSSTTLISCPKEVNVQEMMTFADCLISDYSGAILDFLLLNKPIINYIYDYEFYRDVDSGLYYPLAEFTSGYVAYDFKELIYMIENSIVNPECNLEERSIIKKKFMEYELGTASKQLLDIVLE